MALLGDVHITSAREKDLPQILELLTAEGIPTEKNPDLYIRVYGAFGIDEARELSERASARAFNGRRVFIIIADSLSREAQNALLKTLEEPRGEALFIFLVPSAMQLLPTFRSRAQILALSGSQKESSAAAVEFLVASPQKRLDMLKPLLEKNDDKRDSGAILEFLASLERVLATRVQEASARDALRAVYRAREFIADRGALVKPLLEQVALLV